jgi:hypothetical protein
MTTVYPNEEKAWRWRVLQDLRDGLEASGAALPDGYVPNVIYIGKRQANCVVAGVWWVYRKTYCRWVPQPSWPCPSSYEDVLAIADAWENPLVRIGDLA